MNNLGRYLTIVSILIFLSSILAHAQTSQVSGQVHDTTEAAVAGAAVTLTRVETGDHRTIVSSEEGYYSFPLLLPGRYQLKVENEGFETQNETGIVVETGAISAVNVTLKVGSKTQTVDVDA